MNTLTRIKELPIWLTIGAIVTAVLMAFAGAQATRFERRAKRAETTAENIVQDHTKKNIEKAKKLQVSAAKDKKRAAAAKKKAEERLDAIGAKDETLDDIANRFNSRRLRQ